MLPGQPMGRSRRGAGRPGNPVQAPCLSRGHEDPTAAERCARPADLRTAAPRTSELRGHPLALGSRSWFAPLHAGELQKADDLIVRDLFEVLVVGADGVEVLRGVEDHELVDLGAQ